MKTTFAARAFGCGRCRLRWRWQRARRSAPDSSCKENSGSGLGNAFAGGAAVAET